jgi:hypothetical protein
MNRIRFNGDIITRLKENPIRILRYFRWDKDIWMIKPNNFFFSKW